MASELEARTEALRALGISETRISELLGASDKCSLGTTPSLDENSTGTSQEPGDKPNQEWVQRLQEALDQKQGELTLRERNLASSYYANDEWTKKQITHLQAHISQIQRYLNGGHDLPLPRCCRNHDYLCLIAIMGATSCIMVPTECGFSLKF